MTIADSVETLGVDLRTRVKKLGAKEQARRKKCKVRFSNFQKRKSVSEGVHEGGSQEVVTSGYDASKDLASPCSGVGSHGEKLRTQMAAAAAGKKSTTSLSLFMDAYGLEVKEALSTLATQYWAEGIWTGKWYHKQREAYMKQIQ